MARKTRPPRTVFELVYARTGGLREASAVITFVICWSMARGSLGDEWPTSMTDRVEAYSTWWKTSRATTYRDLAKYREALPEWEDPDDLCRLAEERMAERYRPEAIGALAVPL